MKVHGERPIVCVKNLSAGYGREVILEDVNFDVFPGEILAILGGSGCGKSTLLRHMTGLAEPGSGEIEIAGIRMTRNDDASFQQAMKRIGVLFQGAALIGSMTLVENVALPILEHTDLPRDAVWDFAKMKLGMVGLTRYEDHLPSEISGGMKKRAGLARALALSPSVLFLDEPSAGLDPITSAEIDDLIIRINRSSGTTVIVVTHELSSIFRIAGRVIMLDKQKKGIIASGDPRVLKQSSNNPFVRRFLSMDGVSDSPLEIIV